MRKLLLSVLFLITITSMTYSQPIDTLYRKGNDAIKNNNYEAALSYFNIIISKSPKEANAYNSIGFIYLMMKN